VLFILVAALLVEIGCDVSHHRGWFFPAAQFHRLRTRKPAARDEAGSRPRVVTAIGSVITEPKSRERICDVLLKLKSLSSKIETIHARGVAGRVGKARRNLR